MTLNAVKKTKGPCVILAGAGTGKTYTIVEKIKYLIENKIYAPEKIVCITFSNEAANNLLLRIDKALNGQSKVPIVRTFHGFSSDLLRKYGERIGINKDFMILDPEQAMVVLHRNLKVNAINCRRYIGTIGTVKDLGIVLEEFQRFLENEIAKYNGLNLQKKMENLNFELQTLYLRKEYWRKKELLSEARKIKKILELKKFVSTWNAYEKLKKKGNYQDYSDLNKNALLLLEKSPELAEEYDYVIVDEFQDTNKLQLDFLVRLARKGSITIVGDINQSIYRFRGAYRENLALFKKYFSVNENDIFTLALSYRSPNKVLRVAHKLILNNYENPEECFFVENFYGKEGEKVRVFELKDSREEARKIVEIIQEEMGNGTPLEEICVMFRVHQYGRIIRKALEEAGIQYHAVSKTSLLKQKSVKTAYDYLAILNKLKKAGKGGEQAWWDLVYRLDFQQKDLIAIGKAIKAFIGGRNRSMNDNTNDKIENFRNEEKTLSEYLFTNLIKFELSGSGKIAAKVLVEKIKMMLEFADKKASELLLEVYRISGLANEQKTIEEKEAMLNLYKFHDIAKSHEELYDNDLENFLYYLNVLQELGIEIEAAQLEEKGVRLMTSHATKGLEYGVVIITNCAQGRFPLEKYSNNNLIPTELLPEVKNELKDLSDEEKEEFVLKYEKYHHLLEERRLAYVSFTRAKEKLILTFADKYGEKKVIPSVFLDEIFYVNNENILFEKDFEEKYREHEMKEKQIYFSRLLDASDFEIQLENLANLAFTQNEKEEKKHQRFSPSALLLFNKCQKEFEYKYLYNMPERKTISWEAMRLGSFVHMILEKGVNAGFKNAEDFLLLAKEMHFEEEWEGLELEEAETLIRVFFERHKGRYNQESKTEQYLPLKLAGMDFIGFADRIDFSLSGATIVDYKTGRTVIASRDRNLQLGFYALAAKEKYGEVRKVVLDMLKQERPLEFEIDNDGNAKCITSKFIDGFNIYEIKEELIATAQKIQEAYAKGFKPCSIEKNCDFCNEYVYGL